MKIVAEIGSNWSGLSDIYSSIEKAKELGADAVKFQLFKPSDMYSDAGQCEPGVSPHLDMNWLSAISKACEANKVEFMCTAFSSLGYWVVNQHVETHKIASAEITDLNMLATVNEFSKPVYLSTGGARLDQISAALAVLKDCPVTIFYCVTDYPARIVDFRHLDKLVETFKGAYEYGYSDHSIDVLNIPLLAKYHGAKVIEKHVNFTDLKHTDDAPHSLNAQEFGLMVKSLHGDPIVLEDTARGCGWQRKPDANLNYYRVK